MTHGNSMRLFVYREQKVIVSEVFYFHYKVGSIYGLYKRDRNASYPGRTEARFAAGTRAVPNRHPPGDNIRIKVSEVSGGHCNPGMSQATGPKEM